MKTHQARNRQSCTPFAYAIHGVPAIARQVRRILHAREEPGRKPSVPEGFEPRFAALQGGGRPLPDSERAFFEPRFGRDLSGVRLHSGPAAGELARSVHARAFTLGNSIVLGAGEGGQSGRELLAHELTHVVQQDGAPPGVVRRQTIHTSCSEKKDILNEAWAEGLRLARETANSLDSLLEFRRSGRNLAEIPGALSPYRNAFGDDVVDSLTDLSSRFRLIESGFTEGKILRCDPGSVPKGEDDCEQFDAFVHPDHRTDIFFCPSFFAAGKNATGRGVTLVHEMAHRMLGIGHLGGKVQSYSCEMSFGFRYAVARKNAYSYGILADCLHGEGSQGEDLPVAIPPRALRAGRSDSRFSLSGGAGAGAQGFAAVLGSKISLNTGEFVVWNPTIGFNLLSLPAGSVDPSRVVAATAELGLRIQKPLKGFYFDVSAGGFTTFDATRGLTGTAGLGARWKRLELGVEARAVVPGTDFDNTDVLILGRAALRFR